MPFRILPLLFLVACMSDYRASREPLVAAPAIVEQKPKLDSYLFVDSLREIRFLVSTHMHMSLGVQCQVEEITLTTKGEKEPYRRIAVKDMHCPCPTAEGQFAGVQLMDFNFDGRKDIRVMRMAADLTNPEHNYWLWDEAERTFTSSAILDSIQQPMFDNERKMVSSQWYDGGLHRGGSTFRYENGRLRMVSNMEKFKEGDHERWVTWGMKDGRFQPVQEKEVPLPKR
jgi:hypothetical protein